MVDAKLFFSQYQVNYFDYKQCSLKYLLDNYSKVALKDEILDYNEEDYINTIRCDIRQTYFQAIEAMFELFFALIPDRDLKIHQKMLEILTISELPYQKIKDIAENKDLLDFLEDIGLLMSNNEVVKLGEFIFYYGFYNQKQYHESIKTSISAIKYALWILAKEFSDRSEYNSYKHGLRIIPAFRNIYICNSNTNKKVIDIDLKNSMTFYSFDKKNKETSYITKNFDTERDLRMTSLCTGFLWLMVKLRDVSYNKEEGSKVALLFFNKKNINDAIKTNVKDQDIKYSVKAKKIEPI